MLPSTQRRRISNEKTDGHFVREANCDEIVLEAYTGTKMARPKFTKLIERLNDGKAEAKSKNPDYREDRKTLVIPEFDIFREKVAEGTLTVT